MRYLLAAALALAACGGSDSLSGARPDFILAICGSEPCPGATHEIMTTPVPGSAIQPSSPATLVCYCAAGSLSGVVPPSAADCSAIKQAWAAGQCH